MDKRIFITGANGGLASETIKHLISDGFTDIVMGCRSKSKGLKAREEVLSVAQDSKTVSIEVVDGFDMNDPNMIEMAVSGMSSSQKFDIVFLAAGGAVFTDDFQSTKWRGMEIERTVFQNVMGSHVTLSLLKKHNLLSDDVRVVMAGGEGARGIPGMIKAPFFVTRKALRDYVFKKSGMKYNPMDALGISKFFAALWCLELSEREHENMEVIWFSPGFTYGTGGADGLPPMKRWFMKNVIFMIFKLMGQAQSPEEGGRKNADCIEGKIGENGDLIASPKGKAIGKLISQKPFHPAFTNPVFQEEFWNLVEEVFGEEFAF